MNATCTNVPMRTIKFLHVLTLLALTCAPAQAKGVNEVLSIGDAMPTFANLPAIDGNTLSASDLDADIVILISLANHCPWVRGMDADLVKLVHANEGKNVAFVGFSVNHREDDRLAAMKVHAKKYGYSFPYVFDESQNLGRALGAVYTPEYFVFDKNRKLAYAGLLYNSPARVARDGEVRYTKGEPTEFYVQDAIDALLNGKQPAIQHTKAHGCTVKYETT